MTKQEIIQTMKNWYMPNFYDIDMFDYTKMTNDEIYQAYLEECETFGKNEIDEQLKEHLR